MSKLSDLDQLAGLTGLPAGMKRPDGYPNCTVGWDLGRGKLMIKDNPLITRQTEWKATVYVSATLRYCAKTLSSPASNGL